MFMSYSQVRRKHWVPESIPPRKDGRALSETKCSAKENTSKFGLFCCDCFASYFFVAMMQHYDQGKATFRRKESTWACSFREWVHEHRGRVGMELEQSLRTYILIHKLEAEKERDTETQREHARMLTGNGIGLWNLKVHLQWQTFFQHDLTSHSSYKFHILGTKPSNIWVYKGSSHSY